MKQTKKEIKMKWRGYIITIPKGTPTTNKTAMGIDKNYNFVNSFDWIEKDMPLLRHDAIYYGIDIPKENIEEI